MLAIAIITLIPARHAVADNPPLTGWMEQFILNETPLPVPETAMQNGEGETLTLNSFRGKVLLVNFWATWCAPCIREMPSLDRLQAALNGQNFQVIAINSDRQGGKVAQPFLKNLGIQNLDTFIDEKMAIGRGLGVKGLPASFLISADGQILGRLDGLAEWDSPEALALIQYYLKQG
jgi:thiol-disulfide isomerase/thioredoxin